MENKINNKVFRFMGRRYDSAYSPTFPKLLLSTYGLNQVSVNYVCATFGISMVATLSEFSNEKLVAISNFLEQRFLLGRTLKKVLLSNTSLKKKLGSYKGIRHVHRLPVRGQRTHSNGKTVRRVSVSL